MIMASMFPLTVGKSYSTKDFPALPMRITFNGKHFYDFGFLVIRESNEQEYLDFLKTEFPEKMTESIAFSDYYYEVHMD